MRFNFVTIVVLCFAICFLSCEADRAKTAQPELSVEEDIGTIDSLFSDMSAKEGMKAAFLHYMEDDGVIIRPNSNPLVGADAVDFLSELDDSDFKMTWKADRYLLSASNDLGYAYGRYSITTSQIDSALKGNYVHVWKKLEDGNWKFVLNSWNEAAPE
jgi:ketosteroid isomerase-like protein